ncbi:aminotransferase [Streptomyces tateyamensis]|uniref:Aminotransferase n=1 Tax=Streptomyces tateyamensis TaxID=565073 RepID=A0A2V4P9U0_9ACTN|nr:aminotransferase class I/II-fold pyridoxal phosphate-dependent enzyme [Streptomyces tateyamensis]AXG25735.1 aminotransferase [Streptomyces tateyamensis]PYC80207.1 aminotransferase [Streptomyces tateyamensis]
MSAAAGSPRLDRNELPHPPGPAVLDRIGALLPELHRYPGNHWQARAVAAIAEHNDCPPDQVLLGAGSSRVLELAWRALVTPGSRVCYAAPGFELYPVLTRQQRAVALEVPLTAGFAPDLERLAELARTEQPALLAVITPHSPSGTPVGAAELARLLDRVPPRTVVVLDQAYLEFDAAADPRVFARFARQAPNVLVTRTFSKAYGLAGLRIGYALGNPELLSRLAEFSMPFTVSEPACAAAAEVLRDTAGHAARTAGLRAERSRLTAGLRAAGLTVVDSAANFVLLPGQPGLAEHLRSRGIAVSESPVGTRLTVGTAEDRAAVLAAVADCPSVSG